MSGRLDSNQRPLAPHASALPGCATSRKRLAKVKKNTYWIVQVNFFLEKLLLQNRHRSITKVKEKTQCQR